MDIKGTCISSIADEHGPIYVYQTRTSRILSFDGKIYQSCMKLNDINGLHLGYTRAMMVGLLFIPTVKTATVMGLKNRGVSQLDFQLTLSSLSRQSTKKFNSFNILFIFK